LTKLTHFNSTNRQRSFFSKTIKSVGRQTGRVIQRQQGKVGTKNMGAAIDQHKRGRESVSDLLKREKKPVLVLAGE
jgi:hypothetical protein